MRKPIVLAALLAGLAPAAPARAAAPDTARFAYEQRDKDQEQRTFLLRLKQDKAKLDLAVENTKRLIDRSRQRPYLPELYLRLAELYVEKSRVVFFIRKTELPEGVKSLESLESNTLKKQAIEVYHRILNHYPDFADRDKVMFFLAHEYRELGQIDQMVAQYEEIIRRYPESRYAAESHLLLGDHRFTAQELEAARAHYQGVLEYPESPAVPIARYKLAWCHINTGDFQGAIRLFEEAVLSSQAHTDVDIDTYKKVDIRLESLIDMAFCYGEQYKDASPEEAIAYFERHAWSRPSLTTALEKLANRFFVRKKWEHSAAVYRKLSSLQQDPEKLLEYAARVFECVRATGSFAQADRDMGLIVKALRKQQTSVHVVSETKQKNLKQYELYARDLATHLHQSALKSQSEEEFRLAAAAYKAYLGFFETSEVRDEMRVNYAESLFSARRFVEAGKQFEAIARDLPQSEREREEGLYNAVLAYHSALQEKDGLSAYDKVYARSGLREAGRAYTQEYPVAKNVPKVLFHVAWVAYDEGNFTAAVEEFSRYAEAYPGTAEAKAAVHLVLDAYHVMEDYEGLVRYGQGVLARGDLAGPERAEIAEIVRAAESKVLYPLALAVADDWTAGRQGLVEFADSHQGSALGEQALQAVLASAAELRDLATLFPTASRLLEQYPDAGHKEQTLNLLVDTSLQASQYRRVAFYLEEFARRLPQHPTRAEVLWKAAQIRDRLGDAKAASNDYSLLLGGSLPKGASIDEVVPAATRASLRAGDPELALKLALDHRDRLKGSARIRNEAALALLFRARGDLERSESHREQARDAFQRNLDLGDQELADAVAEVEFRATEPEFERYTALRLGPDIDGDLVQRKGDLYGALLKSYHKLMQSQSPRWALAACFRAYEINAEFSRFLLEAPLPDLPEEQRAQYTDIVAEKARGYAGKGEEYRAKCAELARKWEICDADLARFFLRGTDAQGPAPAAGAPVDADWLQREDLLGLHTHVLKSPGDPSALAQLAAQYVRLGDYGQAAVIAEAALEREDVPASVQASLLNTLGVARCYAGDDARAKEAFQRAIERDPEQRAAKVNLAGLYRHYEHLEKAQALYDSVGLSPPPDVSGDLIHPRSQELYHAFARSARL